MSSASEASSSACEATSNACESTSSARESTSSARESTSSARAAATLDALYAWLDVHPTVAVAVSGGIDSLTLATAAGRRLGGRAVMYHAVSPAVPPEATARVQALAAGEHWNLHLLDAGEFAREDYVANPVNRCYFCKQSLYSVVARSAAGLVVSGANADDLGEYRPGLDAAREAGVRHPWVELGVRKAVVRSVARALGLGALSALPASPCLSSRVETGIAISADMLARIHAAERAVNAALAAAAVRCRVRAEGVVIEIEAAVLQGLDAGARERIACAVRDIFHPGGTGPLPAFAPYRNGSAFLVRSHDRARHPA